MAPWHFILGIMRENYFFTVLKKYIFHTLYVQLNSKGAMQCMRKLHEKAPWAINNMDDAGFRRQCLKKKKKKEGKETSLCPFLFGCRRPVTYTP